METKGYTLRRLRADDLFLLTKIVNGAGIKEIAEVFKRSGALDPSAFDGKTDEEVYAEVGVGVAMEAAGVIIGNLDAVKGDLYKLLGSLSGQEPQAVAAMDAVEFFDMVTDVVQMEQFKDFFARFKALSQ